MKNRMDTRNRSAFDVVADLRKIGSARLLAVLGTHQVDAGATSDALALAWPMIVGLVGFEPVRLLTGCSPSGVEKAVRIFSKSVTGKLAVVFHRAEITYGSKRAEEMRDILLAQEAGALLLVTAGKKVCKHARDMFSSRMKRVYEIEVE